MGDKKFIEIMDWLAYNYPGVYRHYVDHRNSQKFIMKSVHNSKQKGK